MSPILGQAIVVIALIILVYYCGRNCIRMLKDELNGSGCSGCSGGCSGCCASCGRCRGKVDINQQ